MSKQVQVKAKAVGYFGIIRVVGDVFEVPIDVARKGASWFEPVEALPVDEPVAVVKSVKLDK